MTEFIDNTICLIGHLDRLRELTFELKGTEPEGEPPEEVQEWMEKKNGR